MDRHDDVRAVGSRVEHLLGELRLSGQPRAAAVAEELVGALVRLYGSGLERVVEIVGADSAGERLLDALAGDPLVESLLLVHDLHPLDTDARVRRAVDGVRRHLGSYADGLEFVGVDAAGTVRLRMGGNGHSCGSTIEALRTAVAEAVETAAPETTGVDIERVTGLAPLLQITRHRVSEGAGS